MPKPELSSGQDSFVTIRISKRTALEILVAVAIILAIVLWRQSERQSRSASAIQGPPESASPAPTTPTSSAGPDAPARQSVPEATVHTTAYTPDFGADDLSDSSPRPDTGEGSGQSNISSATSAPADPAYTEQPAYAPSDPPPLSPPAAAAPVSIPDAPEGNAPEAGRDSPNEPPPDTRSNPRPDPAIDPTHVYGAGSTFPNPLYHKWFTEFHGLHPQIEIFYQSIGSGGGIKQLQNGTVDFAATDGPMTNEQLAQTPMRIVHVPTVLGAVVITHNVPGVNTALRFSANVLADIFLGTIRVWNDPRIQRDNPELRLPDAAITVIHRSDPNGSTYTFTDYLSKISPEWSTRAGRATAVNWPVGLAGRGNEGAAGAIKQIEGSIGYIDLIYAVANKMVMGNIQNSAGQFTAPNVESIQAAAASVRSTADDFRVSITNPPGKTAYPISAYTWVLVPHEWRDANRKRAFLVFLNWMVDQGEAIAPGLGYVPLPKAMSLRVKQSIRNM